MKIPSTPPVSTSARTPSSAAASAASRLISSTIVWFRKLRGGFSRVATSAAAPRLASMYLYSPIGLSCRESVRPELVEGLRSPPSRSLALAPYASSVNPFALSLSKGFVSSTLHSALLTLHSSPSPPPPPPPWPAPARAPPPTPAPPPPPPPPQPSPQCSPPRRRRYSPRGSRP